MAEHAAGDPAPGPAAKAPAYPKASSPGRSANMRAIRRTDTKPELALRRALHRLGYRFRKDHRLDLETGVVSGLNCRSRATVGNPMPWAKTPAAKSRSARSRR